MKTLLAASHGTKTKDPMNCSATIEGTSAVLAFDHTTWVADFRGSGAREKILAALMTSDDGIDARERTLFGKLWVASPKGCLSGPVALAAKRDEVIELIGFSVVSEKTEWAFVVDDLTGDSAFLTCSTVPRECRLRLTFPVRPAIAIVTTKPTWAVLSSPFVRSSPSPETLPRTEIPFGYGAGLLEESLPADVASNLNFGRSDADAVDLLPCSVARETAEVIRSQSDMVGTPLELFLTPGTGYNRHAMIIRGMDY